MIRKASKKLVYQRHFETRDEARIAIFEYIEIFYNRERLHSSLNYQSPDTFELNLNQIEHELTLIELSA